MSRKNQIEGQINLFDVLGIQEDVRKQAGLQGAEESQEKDWQSQDNKKQPVPGSFAECTACWCATCEHSTVGGGIPRSFGDKELPCPSCELCVKEGAADVCVIGSADEGCRYRAEKEGISE